MIRRFIRCVRWKMKRGIQKRSSPMCHVPMESAIKYGEAATSSSSGSRSLRSGGGIELPSSTVRRPLDALPESLFPNSPVSSTNRLMASSASGPSASIVAVSPQLRLAHSTSRMLAAENRSLPLMSQIWERKAFAARTNSAAGRACSPSSFTILISRLISSDFVFSFCKTTSALALVQLRKLFPVDMAWHFYGRVQILYSALWWPPGFHRNRQGGAGSNIGYRRARR